MNIQKDSLHSNYIHAYVHVSVVNIRFITSVLPCIQLTAYIDSHKYSLRFNQYL